MDVKAWLPPAVRGSASEHKLAVGQVLFSRGDRAAGLYEVASGKVTRMQVDSDGRELVLGIASAGDTFAEASLFSPIHHCATVAIATTVVRFYQKAAVLAEFARNPQAAHSFAELLAHQVLELGGLELRNIYSARDRVRHHLAAGAAGGCVVLPGSVKDLAGELGLTHEALYRTLSEMEGTGEIARHKGKIRLARALYDRVHVRAVAAALGASSRGLDLAAR